MSLAAGLSSIDCTSCGAGLSVLGGGRVTTHVCGYCGAVLDAQEDYRVLASIGARDHPASPVRIGDSITVEGVPMTVIGTLGMNEWWPGGHANWTEHMLYSPTHGYAWLSVEDGNFLFTRKLRELPDPAWITPAQVEASESRPVARLGAERFRYYESGTAEITFMEGEFNWRPEIGEKTHYVTLLSGAAMLTYALGPSEREIERTVLLDREAVAAEIGREAGRPAGMHPLTPYRPVANEGFMRNALVLFAALALVGALWFGGGGREVLAIRDLRNDALPQDIAFEVTAPDQLVEVRLDPDVYNGWVLFEVEVTGPEGEPVAFGGRAAEYYTGVESGERWNEGSGRTSFRFRPVAAGPHILSLAIDEEEPWGGTGRPVSRLDIRIRERRPAVMYMLLTAGLFALGAMVLVGRRANHGRRRWAGSDWTDED